MTKQTASVTSPWAWNHAKIVETLGAKVAMSAMAGKPSPVAARVLARLESAAAV